MPQGTPTSPSTKRIKNAERQRRWRNRRHPLRGGFDTGESDDIFFKHMITAHLIPVLLDLQLPNPYIDQPASTNPPPVLDGSKHQQHGKSCALHKILMIFPDDIPLYGHIDHKAARLAARVLLHYFQTRLDSALRERRENGEPGKEDEKLDSPARELTTDAGAE